MSKEKNLERFSNIADENEEQQSDITGSMDNAHEPLTQEELDKKIEEINEKYKGHAGLEAKKEEEINFWKDGSKKRKSPSTEKNDTASGINLLQIAREMQTENSENTVTPVVVSEVKQDSKRSEKVLVNTFVDYFETLSKNPIKGEEDIVQQAIDTVSETLVEAKDFATVEEARGILEKFIVDDEGQLGKKIKEICEKKFQQVVHAAVEAEEVGGLKISQSLNAAVGALEIISTQSREIGLPEKYVARLTEALRAEWLSDDRLISMLGYHLGKGAPQEITGKLHSDPFRFNLSGYLSGIEEISNLIASEQVAQLMKDRGFDSQDVKNIWQQLITEKVEKEIKENLKYEEKNLLLLKNINNPPHHWADKVMKLREEHPDMNDEQIYAKLHFPEKRVFEEAAYQLKNGIEDCQNVSHAATKLWEEVSDFKKNTDAILGEQSYLNDYLTKIETLKTEASTYAQQEGKFQEFINPKIVEEYVNFHKYDHDGGGFF